MYREKKKITMVTAFSYPSAVHVNKAEIDVVLVGDSLAMVELGHRTTQPVTMDQMLSHCQAVARGATRPFLIGDMPFGSYESSNVEAYRNAIRFLKEAGMDCVKLEGGKERVHTIRHLVDGGVAVMGHIGLTPQRVSVLGGYRAHGRTNEQAQELISTAKELENAGVFSLVIECVPSEVGQAITEAIKIPTIGVGAGPYCSGQALVYHDLLGVSQGGSVASFCKTFVSVGDVVQKGLLAFRDEVRSGEFPSTTYSPYKFISKQEQELFQQWAKEIGIGTQ